MAVESAKKEELKKEESKKPAEKKPSTQSNDFAKTKKVEPEKKAITLPQKIELS